MPVNTVGSKTAAPDPHREIALPKPEQPTSAQRAVADTGAHRRLVDTVERYRDVAGNGQEVSAEGDPRITERRGALSALLARKSDDPLYVDLLERLGERVKADIQWLRAADLRDYSVDTAGQFSWAQSNNSTPDTLESQLKTYVNQGIKDANEFLKGKVKFFDASDANVMGLRWLFDRDDRAKALVDSLWQLRARTDQGGTADDSDARIDKLGPVLAAGLRIVLASAEIGDYGEGRREYALLREVVGSHPISSVNSIFDARNAVGMFSRDGAASNYGSKTKWLTTDKPPGATQPPYEAIHHNFSRETVRNVRLMLEEWLFPVGPRADRARVFAHLVNAMRVARRGDAAAARRMIDDIVPSTDPASLQPLQTALAAISSNGSGIADAIRDFLKKTSTKELGDNPEANLGYAEQMYAAVSGGHPTVDSLALHLFTAGTANAELSDVLYRMQLGDELGLLTDLGEARLAMRSAITASKTGFARQQRMLTEASLNRLHCEELGAAVTRVGDLSSDAQKAEALVAMHSALMGVDAAALDALCADPSKHKSRFEELTRTCKNALDAKKVGLDAYRALMAEAVKLVTDLTQDIRAYFTARAGDVSSGGAVLDDEFIDQFVKQTPLHYITALATKGMLAGLVEEIGPRRIANIEGMRMLVRVGQAVFPTIAFAETAKDLTKMKVPRDALKIVYSLKEKKVAAGGGLVVDVVDDPGGQSHLHMYAMGNGMATFALPALRTKYKEFFENAQKEGGIYVDDRNGQFVMTTVGYALENKLITESELTRLRPGVNRKITFLKPSANGQGFEVQATHEAMISPQRQTREVELYVPQREVDGVGSAAVSFDDLAKLGIRGRHLAGEKGLVLALLRQNPKLRDIVPDGSVITTGRVIKLLEEAGVWDLWEQVWSKDPKVGVVDDKNFMQSAFYTDKDYRDGERQALQEFTKEALTTSLIAKKADGTKELTAAGQRLYDELLRNPALVNSDNWIARSSYTGEDRPGKSGAGQYESRAHLKDPVGRIEGIIDVIESAWMAEPIENNVTDQIFLKHIMPSVVVQHCLQPSFSGVVITRNLEFNTRNQITYRLVRGFGGGVDGGKAEEGVVTNNALKVKLHFDDTKTPLMSEDDLKKLREIALEVETIFNDSIEKGKGYAIDLEVAYEGTTWRVVQARVLLIDV